jgi:NAD(P)H-hydrate epimerase
MKTLTKVIIRSHIKNRGMDSHKGDFGHAFIFAGSTGRMGAAVIAAKACLRTGTGLLSINVPQEERSILQTTIPEAMVVMRENMDYDLSVFSAAGLGPGIGTDKIAEVMLVNFITQFNKPILLDADALNIIAANKKLINLIPSKTIITPHPKEFDRLFGHHKNSESRIHTAVQKAKEYDIIIVLKSHMTAVISHDKSFLNTTGNAGLAKGGSGDALTGIITAFLAQGYKPLTAAKLGVYLHGLSADITLKDESMESMLITDVISNLGKAFKYILV